MKPPDQEIVITTPNGVRYYGYDAYDIASAIRGVDYIGDLPTDDELALKCIATGLVRSLVFGSLRYSEQCWKELNASEKERVRALAASHKHYMFHVYDALGALGTSESLAAREWLFQVFLNEIQDEQQDDVPTKEEVH